MQFAFDTYEQACASCKYWMSRLGVSNWSVKLEIARHFDMPYDNSDGVSRYTQTNRTARIWLLDPIDAKPDLVVPYDQEAVLVHEILHLVFAPFFTSEDENHLVHIAQEQAIDTIAQALVAARREVGESIESES